MQRETSFIGMQDTNFLIKWRFFMNRLRHIAYSFFCTLICLVVSMNFVFANQLQDARQALAIISDFADKYCKNPPLEGTSEKLELSAEGKVGLSNIIKKMVDLGYKGAAEYQTSEWQGPLQKDIAQLLKDQSNCRMEVLTVLQEKLIPDTNSMNSNDLINKATEKFGSQIRDSLTEVQAGWTNCIQTVINLENQKIEELNKEISIYLNEEKGIPKEQAKSFADEIIQNSDSYQEFENKKKKQNALVDEYNEQLSKNMIANSYIVFAYLIENIDTNISELISNHANSKYEKNDQIELFIGKSYAVRKLLLPGGNITISIGSGSRNAKGIVSNCPSLILSVQAGNSKVKDFTITPSYESAGGARLEFIGGPKPKYKKIEVRYPYKNMKYRPESDVPLNDYFKKQFIKNFTEFMKFAFSACR